MPASILVETRLSLPVPPDASGRLSMWQGYEWLTVNFPLAYAPNPLMEETF